jgi:hypothetical protein
MFFFSKMHAKTAMSIPDSKTIAIFQAHFVLVSRKVKIGAKEKEPLFTIQKVYA